MQKSERTTLRLALSVLLATAFMIPNACQDARNPISLVPPRSSAIFNAAATGPISGQYIIRLRDDEPNPAAAAHQLIGLHGGTLGFVYRAAIKGFSATLPDQAVDAIRKNPHVIRIEQDRIGGIVDVQSNAPWGLDRIDQRSLPLNGQYNYSSWGYGVKIYIIDSGIRMTHQDFGGRAGSTYFDAVGDGWNGNDCLGHGTHVAGIAAGSTYGVAKYADLISVRVINCAGTGTASQAIAGVDYVTGQKNASPSTPMVANMSVHYGPPVVQSLNDAVTNSMNSGVVYAIAAANDTADACNDSPGSTPGALTTGATGSNDSFASFSNWGSCVVINAPGVDILSDWNGSNSQTNYDSGTSMASPHVAGAAALYLSGNPSATQADVRTVLTSNATQNVISAIPGGTPNLLLYSAFITGIHPVTATISGPNLVAAQKWCTWTVTASGGIPPYTSYQWGVANGWLSPSSGTGPSFMSMIENSASFTVYVSVFDATGHGAGAGIQVMNTGNGNYDHNYCN